MVKDKLSNLKLFVKTYILHSAAAYITVPEPERYLRSSCNTFYASIIIRDCTCIQNSKIRKPFRYLYKVQLTVSHTLKMYRTSTCCTVRSTVRYVYRISYGEKLISKVLVPVYTYVILRNLLKSINIAQNESRIYIFRPLSTESTCTPQLPSTTLSL